MHVTYYVTYYATFRRTRKGTTSTNDRRLQTHHSRIDTFRVKRAFVMRASDVSQFLIRALIERQAREKDRGEPSGTRSALAVLSVPSQQYPIYSAKNGRRGPGGFPIPMNSRAR